MNATISNALAQRGLLPQTGNVCKCCGTGGLDIEDMMGTRYTDEFTAAVRDKFGGLICLYCADERTTCEQCGDIALTEDTFDGLCPGCQSGFNDDDYDEWKENE